MVFFQRLLAAILAVALFAAAFVFASLILAAIAVIGVLAWGWLWWRTRGLRREARESQGEVIEGEFRVETDGRRLDERR